jgi:LysM repeat protein
MSSPAWLTRSLALAFLLAGLSACRDNPPPPKLLSAPPTPAPIVLPRYTPHVTPSVPPAVISPTPVRAQPTLPPAPPTPTPSPYNYYVVQPNETLYDVAAKFHVSIEELARINNITDPTTVKPGDKLLIP